MKKILLILCICVNYNIILPVSETSPHIITFFMRPHPKDIKEITPEKLYEKLQAPGKMLKREVRRQFSTVYLTSGIYATYAGYSTHSDMNGQFRFPRKTADPVLYILITQTIDPVQMSPTNRNTLSGFVPDPKALSLYYKLEKHIDPRTKAESWIVSDAEMPKRSKLPYNCIVIFANPKYISISTGTFPTIPGENLRLPDIYITSNYNSVPDALRFLKVRQYFRGLTFDTKPGEYEYQQQIIT